VKTKRKKCGENYILNKAVNKFKEGETKYFNIIYRICLRKLELLATGISFGSLKYDRNDFVQDGLIHIFNKLIHEYDRDRAKFTTLFFREGKQFKYRYIRDHKRKEILIESNFGTDDDVQKDLDGFRERILNGYRDSDIDSKLITKEYFKKLYSLLDKRERKVFRELYKRRYLNDTKDSKIIIAGNCGIKYRRLQYIIQDMESKYREFVLKE